MKQITQNLKTGEIAVSDVPVPAVFKGMVVVENKFSLISAGTEKTTVDMAKASLIGKAQKRPDLVQQVFDNIKREGLWATIEKVKTKLDTLKALGYSSAGVVMATFDKNGQFNPGDRVACAGQDYASHAEVVAVPENLVVKIPDNVTFEEASFVALGSIALQGVRQADVRIGENICVIGLGLLGQLTVQILKANGCNVFGVDISDTMVEWSLKNGADSALNRSNANLLSSADTFTAGKGFDSVIITAGANSNDPVELAVELARKKGKIVVVGAVKMDIQREPHFYRKELELKISCSYGPGRYDPQYEEMGVDYPHAYVRWTEKRNMEAFLQLQAKGLVNVKSIITHIFDVNEATKAYDILTGKTNEKFLGMLFKYSPEEKGRQQSIQIKAIPVKKINIGFIGAGSFAQSYLLPHTRESDVSLDTVVTTLGITAKSVGEKFGFGRVSTNPNEVFNSSDINAVFIATQHDTHAKYVIDGLKSKKKVYVEKPLCLTEEELREISRVYNSQVMAGESPLLMAGFNRRFAPVCVEAKKLMEGIKDPKIINIRVNAGFINKDHWVQNPAVGGGRIIGEVCHFVDLTQYFSNSLPSTVYAQSIRTKNEKVSQDDNLSIIIKFEDGSIGNIVYVSSGDKSLAKERIEIFAGNSSVVIDDFKSGTYYKNNAAKKILSKGKGHSEEVRAFLDALRSGENSPISFESIAATTLTTFRIQDSISTGLPQRIK